ncbi:MULTISPECIES: hypothetical protein [Aeromonas]|uniref:Uncharacterized protein n=1 Tax=Aeromonas veronii TaxID=654 RepID=A0A4S5CDU7_AERVE|nr:MULTISPECIES: hypothetical protein [Aeromonas]THJ43679.1 hypothetical protein E8Q35_15345 [Aeromonas veronii]
MSTAAVLSKVVCARVLASFCEADISKIAERAAKMVGDKDRVLQTLGKLGVACPAFEKSKLPTEMNAEVNAPHEHRSGPKL